MAISFEEAWGTSELHKGQSDDPQPPVAISSKMATIEAPPRKRRRPECDLSELMAELRALRKETARQVGVNTSILYAVAVVALILLVVILHTYNRLHYTTECLLWYAKKS